VESSLGGVGPVSGRQLSERPHGLSASTLLLVVQSRMEARMSSLLILNAGTGA
jgi:hypothetical protein